MRSAATDGLLQLGDPIGLVFGDRAHIQLAARAVVHQTAREDLGVDRVPALGDVLHRSEMDAAHGLRRAGELDDLDAVTRGAAYT